MDDFSPFNHRLTKGLVAPSYVFPRLLKNAKQSDLGHISNLFYIFCGYFDVKLGMYQLSRGKGKSSKSEGEGVDATFFQFSDILNLHFEKYLHSIKLKCLNRHFPCG